jgi:thiol-disulfide isomerase/thioredoxin
LGAFINHYSFLLVMIGIIGVTGLVLLTNKPKLNDYVSFGLITFITIMSWLILHPRQTPLMKEAETVQKLIGSGTPVLLEFQSPYCLSCTQVRPVLDQLEEELSSEASIGPQLHIVWRQIGSFDPQMVRDSLK